MSNFHYCGAWMQQSNRPPSAAHRSPLANSGNTSRRGSWVRKEACSTPHCAASSVAKRSYGCRAMAADCPITEDCLEMAGSMVRLTSFEPIFRVGMRCLLGRMTASCQEIVDLVRTLANEAPPEEHTVRKRSEASNQQRPRAFRDKLTLCSWQTGSPGNSLTAHRVASLSLREPSNA